MELDIRYRLLVLAIVALAAVTAALPAISRAQIYSFTSADSPITLTVNPQSPGPDSSVSFTLSSQNAELPGAMISWYVNGTLASSGTGDSSFTMQTGAAGDTDAIKAVADYADGTSKSVQTTLRPTVVNLLWEADSYTPPFYRGRALPSAGTPVIIHADAQFFGSDGGLLPESSITYTWSLNGSAAPSISGPGKSTVTLAAPASGALAVSVTARTQSGTQAGSQSASIPVRTPTIDLYADDPLLGIIYRSALASGTTLPSSQSTLVAEPYFFGTDSPDAPGLVYAWSVNGTPVLADSGSPSRITVNVAGNGAGTAAVALSLSKTNQPASASGSWTIGITPFRELDFIHRHSALI